MSNPIPADALAANWPPEILEAYLAGVQKAREAGAESDEAVSTDSEPDARADASFSSASTSASTDASMRVDGAADDIASDDSAFSSEDEFAEEGVREQQRVRRALALGRPPAAVVQLGARDMRELHEAYMKQLDDADEELAELTGTARVVIKRRKNEEAYTEMDTVDEGDMDEVVAELRRRSSKEIIETDRKMRLDQLVTLAQALFRKEREIKRLRGNYGDDDEEEGDMSILSDD